jgi:murein DD-endopeptidase MepM/ murein hydrolase activator NlpD
MRKAALRGEEPGTGGIIGWVKDKYGSVKDALKKGMETAFKWVLSKFKGMMGDNNNIVKNSVIGMLEWASDKITAKGKKADEEAESAVASGAEVSAKGWAYPLANRYVITQRPNRGHNPANAVDIGAPMGTKVLAAHAGIAKRGSAYGYGLYMDVFHGSGGTFTRYAHLKSYSVKDNAMVKAGTIIALSDSTGAHTTGPHLHFEYNPGGRQTGDTIAAMRAFGIKLGGGGVVAPSAAGTLALIAEAGQHERVTPLDSEGFTPAERRMLEALETSLGGGSGDQYHVHPAPGMDETHLADLVARRVAWKRRRGAGWR